MLKGRKYEAACDFLRENQLRFSRQRMVVIDELFFNKKGKKHFKINELLKLIEENHKSVNMSNTSLTKILKGLCREGHLREVYVNKPYYDVNTNVHMHMYDKENDKLIDIESHDYIQYINENIKLPSNYKMEDINCIFSVKKKS